MKSSIYTPLFWLAFSLLFIGCQKESEKQAEEDEETIKAYLECHDIDAQKTASGLYYFIEEQGNGDFPTLMDNVTVAYTGYYPSGDVFDESSANGVEFGLLNVIEGWQEGIQLFREGGRGSLFIPSALAYGTTGTGNIGGNAVLLFDIELLDID